MSFSKLFSLALLLVSLCALNFAQTPTAPTESPTAPKDEKEKARLELEGKAFALAERAASDAATLKLPENRAFVFAMAGDLLWKQDQKRARRLFRDAAEELIAANVVAADKDDSNDQMAVFAFYNSPRRNILQTVAKYDADLALELLVQTRSAKLAAEIVKANLPQSAAPPEKKTPAMRMETQSMRFQVQQELQIEQTIAALAAADNPQKAAKLIRDSLAKGVSGDALYSVQKLYVKDVELGNQVLSEVIQKLLDSDFSKQESQERLVAVQVLRQFGQTANDVKSADAKKTPLKVEDKTLRDLANKLADSLMKATNFTALWQLSSALPLLEKYAPDRAAALKQKQAALKKSAPEGMSGFESFGTLNDPNAAPEKLIAEAANVPVNLREMMYRRAVDKLIEKGEIERAKQLIGNAPTGKGRDDALAYVDGKLAEKAAKEGKFDEARKLIAGIGTKSQQIEQLVKLALVFQAKKDKESHETALKIMDEARAMVASTPQSDEEIADLVQVVAGFTVVDPPRAFDLIEPFIDQSNEIIQAAALVAKFQNHQQPQQLFRDGEMVLNEALGQMRGQMRFVKDLGTLAAVDFERTRSLSDKFTRPDVQILARLLIAQSVLQNRANSGDGAGGGFGSGTMISIAD